MPRVRRSRTPDHEQAARQGGLFALLRSVPGTLRVPSLRLFHRFKVPKIRHAERAEHAAPSRGPSPPRGANISGPRIGRASWALTVRSVPPPAFLNIDLEIRSAGPIPAIVEALEPVAHVLHEGLVREDFLTSFEAFSGGRDHPLRNTLRFLRACAVFPPAAQREWQPARSRVLDIGCESGAANPSLAMKLPSRLMRRMLDLRIEPAFTLYPRPLPDVPGEDTP